MRFFRHPLVQLAGVLLLGLALRVGVAGHHGYEFDVGTNQGWGRSVVINGLGTAYKEQVDNTMIPNYPPFSLMIFGGAAWTYKILHPPFEPGSTLYLYLIKTPSMLADLAGAAGLFFLLRRWRGAKTALWAAFAWALHPAVWFVSAVWGQTDALFTLMAFFAIVALAREYLWIGGILAALTVLTKVQGIIFIPVFLLLAIQRPWRSWRFVLSGAATLLIVLLPFILTGQFWQVIHVFTSSAGQYTTLTFMGYNFWWAMFSDPSAGIQDSGIIFGIFTYRQIALLAVALSYAFVLWRLQRTLWTTKQRNARLEAALAATMFCAFSFFLFSTQMHERYLYPILPFGLTLAFLRREYVMPFTLASVVFYFNLTGILPYSEVDKVFFRIFPGWDTFMGALLVFVFFLWISRAAKTSLHPQKALAWPRLMLRKRKAS